MRIIIISDVHANLAALEAVQEPHDVLLCLGDLVNYGPQPGEAIQSFSLMPPRLGISTNTYALRLLTRCWKKKFAALTPTLFSLVTPTCQ